MTVQTPAAPSSIPSVCVSDVMSTPVVSCDPTSDLCHVAGRMARRRIHSVVVSDRATPSDVDDVHGVLSELDLVRTVASTGVGLTAARIATAPLVTVPVHASLTDAAHAMIGAGVAHVLVLDGRRPVGVVSSLDIAAAVGVDA